MLNRPFTAQDFADIAAFIRTRTTHRPRIGLILGSGLSGLADAVDEAESLSYAEIPHFSVSTVAGHAGRLVLGLLEGQPVCVLQGRSHFYEGITLAQVVLPIRVLRALGVESLILTNAAGGINPAFAAGELMLIEDQINLVGMVGHNPLMGPNDPEIGPRFPDMSALYDRRLRELALAVAADLGIQLHRGIYTGLSGPGYESPAEVRFLRMIGTDATGMSTTNEALAARHCGMRLLGFSGISNQAIDRIDSPQQTSHEEVLEAGRVLVPRLVALLRGLLRRWAEAG